MNTHIYAETIEALICGFALNAIENLFFHFKMPIKCYYVIGCIRI